MRELLQIIFDALSLGSLYALGALGIALGLVAGYFGGVVDRKSVV